MTVDELLKLHEKTCEVTREIMQNKNSDYTGGETATDALANFKTATALGLHPVTGLLLRMQDKLMRVRSFVADGKLRVTGETVEDACDDMVNYAILCKALLREEAGGFRGYLKNDDYVDAPTNQLAWRNDRLPSVEDAGIYDGPQCKVEGVVAVPPNDEADNFDICDFHQIAEGGYWQNIELAQKFWTYSNPAPSIEQ